jgi:hypothetical protein
LLEQVQFARQNDQELQFAGRAGGDVPHFLQRYWWLLKQRLVSSGCEDRIPPPAEPAGVTGDFDRQRVCVVKDPKVLMVSSHAV